MPDGEFDFMIGEKASDMTLQDVSRG